MNEFVNIHLGGKLGKLFGKLWKLNVSSPAEAIRAISINTNGEFRNYLETEGRNKNYKVCIGNKKNILSKEEVCGRTGKSDIYIIPIIKTASSGVAKILVGIALVALAFTGVGALAAIGITMSTTAAGALTTAFASAGIGLALGGIVQLMTPVPKMQREDNRSSSIFQGNAATISQNTPVGLIYGRTIVSPMPIALSYDNYPESNTNKDSIAIPELIENPDGSFYYDF